MPKTTFSQTRSYPPPYWGFTVKPSAQPTQVRTLDLPPPAKTARDRGFLRARGPSCIVTSSVILGQEAPALAKIASPMADGPFDLHVYPRVEPDEAQPAGWRCVVPVGLLTPRSHGRPLRFPPGPHDGVLDRWIRSTHAHYWHLAGTCRMGPDPAKGAAVSTPEGGCMACEAFASLTPRYSSCSRAPPRRCPRQSPENGLPT